MYIEIGPYPTRWISKVHDRYMNKKYGYDWPAKQSKFENFLERLEDTLQLIYDHTINLYLDNKKRRCVIAIHPYDTWSMDHTLSLIIVPMLKQLKETKHGSPFIDDEDVPVEIRSTSARPLTPEELDNGGTDEFFHDRWEWVLDEMIWAFNEIAEDKWEEQYHHGKIDFIHVPIDENGNECAVEDAKYFELREGPNDTHTFDKEGWKTHSARIANGTRLFGKYFQSLWD